MFCLYNVLFTSNILVYAQITMLVSSSLHSINKVFDYVIIELYQNTLMSSDMQFAYKSQHSTALCSVVYFETLQYYKQNGSQVYSCLLDASKAFDRIHYGKLFNILINK